MAHPLLPTTIYAIHMHAPSVSGGKDWVGSVDAGGIITVFWGKTGQINNHAQRAGGRSVLNKMIQEKIAKGYAQTDEYKNGTWGAQSLGAKSAPSWAPPIKDHVEDLKRKHEELMRLRDITKGISAPAESIDYDF